MPFTLHIYSYRHRLMPALGGTPFEVAGGTIGRDADNTLVLDDPDLHISRIQARIDCRDGVYYMRDLGLNPSLINACRLGNSREAQLEHGDLLTIGTYVIAVQITSGLADGKQAQAPGSFELAVLSHSVNEPFGGDALTAAAILSGDPGFDDSLRNTDFDPLGVNLFGRLQAAATAAGFSDAEHQHISPETQSFPGVLANFERAATVIPEDYDPLANYLPARLSPSCTASSYMAQLGPDGGGALADAELKDPARQALLAGLNLSGFQPGVSTPELAQVAAVMLRLAMPLLSCPSWNGYEMQCTETLMALESSHPAALVSTFQDLLQHMSSNPADICRATAA